MALITWEELIARSKPGLIIDHPIEAKKAFDYYIKRPGVKTKDIATQMKEISSNIRTNLKRNKGKFVITLSNRWGGPDPRFEWDTFVKKNPKFPEAFEAYLARVRAPRLKELAKKNISLKEKYNLLPVLEKKSARMSMRWQKPYAGLIPTPEFAPFTNFKVSTVLGYMNNARKDLPKATTKNARLVWEINKGKAFVDHLEKSGIKILKRSGPYGHTYFTKPNTEQAAALKTYLNLWADRAPSATEKTRLLKLSREHPLYKDTSANLKTILKEAKYNLNTTIKGYNNPGLTRFLKRNPNMLKNATMRFNPAQGKFEYTSIADLSKKGFNFGELRHNLVFEIEHNRSTANYLRDLGKDGRMLAKHQLLNDAEFAHNLTLDTYRYNRAKTSFEGWLRNPINQGRTTQIATLEKELADLGHRYHAGGEWKGQAFDFKPRYKDTVLDSWSKALEKSTGMKWDRSKFQSLVSQKRWNMAMKEVTMNPDQLRTLGNFFGCPGTFKGLDEGGRVRLQAGGQGLSACVSTKLKQPGAIEKIAALPEEVGGALGKLKNTARGFLSLLGRGGARAAPLAALAAAGAAIEPLVKQFRIDDPTTYLTDESQMKGMLLATIEGETPKVDEEILKWQMPALGAATAAGAIPGAGTLYKQRRAVRPQKLPGQPAFIGPMEKGVGPARAALGIKGVLGKALGASFSPLAVAATLPMSVAAQRSGGTDWSDIATDPSNWFGPAFAASGADFATKGMKSTGILAKAIRMGMSPGALRMGSRFLGLPGLALTGGMWGYDKWKNWGKDKDDEFKVRTYKDDDD